MGAEDELAAGLYEELVTERIRRRVEELVEQRLARTSAVDGAEGPGLLGRHVGAAVASLLERMPEVQRVAAVNRLLDVVLELEPEPGDGDGSLVAPGPSLLLDVRTGGLGEESPVRPMLPLRRTDLLVNARGEPQLAREVAAEIASTSSVELLCAFLKHSGVLLVREALSGAVARGAPIRVLTTTYMGATDQRAVDELVRLGAEVRVSFEVLRTRLHAKAWLLRRPSGLDTAYVGSSNLSRAAMTEGLEWNVRISRSENPLVLDKFASTFESYWNSGDFETYDPEHPEDVERLRRALAEATGRRGDGGPLVLAGLEVRPFPFQQEILNRLEVERELHGRWRNLVVAATGTGKTVVAALDYRRLRGHTRVGKEPTLLFVAHRREILEQSRRTFAAVIGDPLFGEVLVGGQEPQQWRHVFASVQSLGGRIAGLDPSRFDIVIIDEFHHAEAPTYQRLLDHLQPKVLVGLTATPERGDGQDVRHWFDDQIAAELRLWEALERDLLCPFHYFAAFDGTDVAGIEWKRGSYDTAGLDGLYTGNDARARVVLREIEDKVTDPHLMRALGFCVSVDHARYMARVTTEAGLAAVALDGTSPADERAAALRDLRAGRIQVIYSVDLFNEGLDVPAVDTILLLRPTESATVFLQQLGRGLRHDDGKSHVTVLDFLGYQHKRFRFDLRFQALTGLTRAGLRRAVDDGFPFLPSGCHIQLDRVAADVVLENLRGQLRADAKSIAADLTALGDVGLAEFLHRSGRELADVYQGGRSSFTAVRRRAGVRPLPPPEPDEPNLLKRLHRLASVDDVERAQTWRSWFEAAEPPTTAMMTTRQTRLAAMLFFSFWPRGGGFGSYDQGFQALWSHPALCAEATELLSLAQDRIGHLGLPLPAGFQDVPLWVHARYSREELLAGLGQATLERTPASDMQGVRQVRQLNADVFTFTVNKSEKDYSPTTMYRDYAISPDLIHWESQSTTSAASPTGKRYIHHVELNHHILLFGRLREKDDLGTAPFLLLGPATYVRHEGSNPVAITWRLHHRLPMDWYHDAALLAG